MRLILTIFICKISSFRENWHDLFERQKETDFLTEKIEVNSGNHGRGIFSNRTIRSRELLLKTRRQSIITPD